MSNNVRKPATAIPLAATLTALAVIAVIGAGPASAHVHTDESQQPPQGGYGAVTLIVPTESDTESTVGLAVTIPDGVDLSSARTLPIAGWTATVETEPATGGQRVSRIVWKAQPDAGLGPTEFGQFTFSAGPWPEDTDTVTLVSDQTYSDGEVVSWNEIALDANTEPEHPAPVVTLGVADEHGTDQHGAAPGSASHEHEATVAASVGTDSWFWRATSIVSLLVALATAGALAVVVRRSRDAGS